MLQVLGIEKTFVLHSHGSMRLPVLRDVFFSVAPGETVVLTGSSGSGKSTMLRILSGNYVPTSGRVLVAHKGRTVDIVTAPPRLILEIRRWTIGCVSQFLRVIPRVSTIGIVREPLLLRGTDTATANRRAAAMLERVALPQRLWPLAPQTFSGGEQQRVNIARSFAVPSPIVLLDEPTASLDATNRDIVVELIDEARRSGSAIVGIFHDEATRTRVATRCVDVGAFKPASDIE